MKTTTDSAIQKAKHDRIDWSKADDQTLIAGILDRENGIRADRAWSELFNRHDATINKRLRRVIGNCSRIFRSSDTFEEIKAEVIAALLANNMGRLRAFDASKGTLAGWLSMIANQTALRHLTKLVRDGVPDPIEAIEADDCDAGFGEEDRDVHGDGQIGARWLAGVNMAGPERLASIIDAADVSFVDGKRQIVFAWFGGDTVHVFDKDADEVHRFNVQKKTPQSVRNAISRERYERRLERALERAGAQS